MTFSAQNNWRNSLLDRVSGTRLMSGHSIRLMLDSREHEPCVLEMIKCARHHIHIEHYLAEDDVFTRQMLTALCDRARAGVKVRVLLDFIGSLRLTSRWIKALQEAGGSFRWFNIPQVGEPLGWLVRNHRKLISVDGTDALLGGWCLSARWRGSRPDDPWRDTGVLLSGPAVAIAEEAFVSTWNVSGQPEEIAPQENLAPIFSNPHDNPLGSVDVRLLAGRPQSNPFFVLEQMAVATAKKSIWITDAYPVITPGWLNSMRRAAEDGVDVRLLVPGTTDLPLLGMLSRSSYRAMLEAGIRVFEWNGGMLHAKSLVIDEEWCRIGSSNSNLASWFGNYELDAVIQNKAFGDIVKTQFLIDLDNATEIVLRSNKAIRSKPLPKTTLGNKKLLSHVKDVRLNAKTPLRVSRSVVLAVRESRDLSPSDAALLSLAASMLFLLMVIALMLPAVTSAGVALISGIVSAYLFRIALKRYRKHASASSKSITNQKRM